MKANFYIFFFLLRCSGYLNDDWQRLSNAKYHTFIFVVDAKYNFLFAILIELLAFGLSLFTPSKHDIQRRIVSACANILQCSIFIIAFGCTIAYIYKLQERVAWQVS